MITYPSKARFDLHKTFLLNEWNAINTEPQNNPYLVLHLVLYYILFINIILFIYIFVLYFLVIVTWDIFVPDINVKN